MPLDINKIIQYPLAANQYNQEDCSEEKKMIFIHHTAGNSNPYLVIDGWNATPEKVGTPFVIGGRPPAATPANHPWQDGLIIQCFSSKYWDYHLGLKTANNLTIAKSTIGVEICNWGGLVLNNGKYYSYAGTVIPEDEVVSYPLGFKTNPKSPFYDSIGATGKSTVYYHKYSDAQIANLKDLIIYLCEKYNIPKNYNEDMWDLNQKALAGDPGIWTHVSVRIDKQDCHPQPELIAALKTLDYHTI